MKTFQHQRGNINEGWVKKRSDLSQKYLNKTRGAPNPRSPEEEGPLNLNEADDG